MALAIGNNAVTGAYLGANQVRRAYKGGTLVYQGFSPASEQEFIRQEAAGGPAQLLKVYGKTIVNNQLVPARSETLTAGGTTAVYTLDGKITITGSTASSVSYSLFISVPLVEGHKYYLAGCPAGGSNSSFSLRYNNNGFGENGDGKILTYSTSQGMSNYMNRVPIIVITNYTITASLVFRPRLIDLTLRFGEGHEPTSVDEALRLLGGDAFNPTYDPGSVQSNKTTELRAERVPVINVWDEEWELGRYNDDTGEKQANANMVRSTNRISLCNSTTYYIQCAESSGIYVYLYFYDAAGRYLGKIAGVQFNREITPLSGAASMAFFLYKSSGITTMPKACINLSDPAINGTYYPHWRGSLALNLSTLTGKLNGEGASVAVFPDGLRGVGTDRDKAYGSTGEVARAVVDLGTRSWTYSARGIFASEIPGLKYQTSGSLLPNLACSKYAQDTGSHIYVGLNDKVIGTAAGSPSIWVRDSAYTDAAAFKAAMSGVMLDYPLATPVTYLLDTPLPTDLTCEQGDKLQRVSDNNCPFVGEMRFGL